MCRNVNYFKKFFTSEAEGGNPQLLWIYASGNRVGRLPLPSFSGKRAAGNFPGLQEQCSLKNTIPFSSQ